MNRLLFKSNIFLSLCRVYIVLFILSPVISWHAAYAQDFEVAPVKLNFAVEPGEIGSKTVTVRNHSNKSQAFVLTLGDVLRDSLGRNKKFPAGTTKRSCAEWITINPSFFELNPNSVFDI